MRVALFAPVDHGDRPEGRDALAFARELARHVELTVFVRVDPTRPAPPPAGLRVESQQAFERAHLAGAFDHTLYFLANDAYVCEFVGRRLDAERMNRPGAIVLLRDATMQHYFQTVTIYLGDARNYHDGMAQAHGALGAHAAPVVLAGGGHDALFRELDMLRFFVEAAAAVVVPNPALERRVRSLEGQLTPLVSRVPRGVAPASASRALRERLVADAGIEALDSDARVYLVRVGASALEREEAAATAAALRRTDPLAAIVLQGAEGVECTNDPRLAWIAGSPPDEGDLPAWDGVVDLRDPILGRGAIEMLRWLSAGVPVVVADFPAFEDVSADALARAPTLGGGDTAARTLADPTRRVSLAERGREHARTHATHAAEVSGLLRFLRTHATELVERTVILGNVRERVLAARRREIAARIRDAVFLGVPVDLPGGLGGRFVDEVEEALRSFGIDPGHPRPGVPRSG